MDERVHDVLEALADFGDDGRLILPGVLIQGHDGEFYQAEVGLDTRDGHAVLEMGTKHEAAWVAPEGR